MKTDRYVKQEFYSNNTAWDHTFNFQIEKGLKLIKMEPLSVRVSLSHDNR